MSNHLITILTLSGIIAEQAAQLEGMQELQDSAQRARDEAMHLREQVYDLKDAARRRETLYEEHLSSLRCDLEAARRDAQAWIARVKLHETYSGPLPDVRELAFKSVMGGDAALELSKGNFIGAIKHVREVTQWGLKDSKDFVEDYRSGKLAQEAQKYAAPQQNISHPIGKTEGNVSHPVCKDTSVLNA